MQIGRNGASLDLQLTGYQFPELEPGHEPLDDRSWDANWLTVAGEARTADGTSWTFQDSILTTWEVGELVSWLQQVANGAVPVLSSEELDAMNTGSYDLPGWLTFTEPALSFAVSDYGQSQMTLRMVLSHALATPPIDPMRPKRSQLTIVTDKRQLKEAADALESQLATFAAR